MNGFFQRQSVRRITAAAAVLLTFMLQNALFGTMKPAPLLLIPLAVCVAMVRGETESLFYGALTGALWDLSAPAPDGVYALLFALLTFACGVLAKRFLRQTLAAGTLLTACFAAAVCLFAAVFALSAGGGRGLFTAALRFYLPQILLTVLFTPLFYYPALALARLGETKTGAKRFHTVRPQVFSPEGGDEHR